MDVQVNRCDGWLNKTKFEKIVTIWLLNFIPNNICILCTCENLLKKMFII